MKGLKVYTVALNIRGVLFIDVRPILDSFANFTRYIVVDIVPHVEGNWPFKSGS